MSTNDGTCYVHTVNVTRSKVRKGETWFIYLFYFGINFKIPQRRFEVASKCWGKQLLLLK